MKMETGNIDKILEERGSRYGEFIDNATIAQELKTYVRGCASWGILEIDQKEAIDNICIKLSRILSKGTDNTYPDNFADIAGYATLVVNRMTQKGNNGTNRIA